MINFNRKRGEIIAAYQKLFDSREGKLVLQDLVKAGHIDIPSFAPDNQYMTAFREGERSIVLRIIKTINKDPAYVMELLAGQSEER